MSRSAPNGVSHSIRGRRPDLHCIAETATGHPTTLAPCHREDTASAKSQHTNQQRQRGKTRTCLSGQSASTGTQKNQSSPSTRFSLFCRRCRWPACRPRSMPPRGHCKCQKSAHESTDAERKNMKKMHHFHESNHRLCGQEKHNKTTTLAISANPQTLAHFQNF